MRIYISGPVTGIDNYMEHFQKAEEYWLKQGVSCINPATVLNMMPSDTTYEEYMKVSFVLLEMCDIIYMLKGWEKSCGANREYGYASGKDMRILIENNELKDNVIPVLIDKDPSADDGTEQEENLETKEEKTSDKAEKIGGGVPAKDQGRSKIDVEKVMELRAAGWSNKKIAEEMGVKPQSISVAVSNWKKKQKDSSDQDTDKKDKMKKTSPEMCLSCVHGAKLGGGTAACEYLVNTGKRRGCPEGYCDKYEKGRKK